MDGAVVLPAPTRLAIAAEEDAEEPALPTTADDLSHATSQTLPPKTGTPAAHCWRASYSEINCLGEEMGEGQSVIPTLPCVQHTN